MTEIKYILFLSLLAEKKILLTRKLYYYLIKLYLLLFNKIIFLFIKYGYKI